MRGDTFFLPVQTTAPAFNSTSVSTSVNYALESSAARRVWAGPANRSVRVISADSSIAFFAKFGASSVDASSDAFLIAGGFPHIFGVPAIATHVSFVSTSAVVINVTIGYGGRTMARIAAISATSTVPPSTEELFTVSQANSLMHELWLSPTPFSAGDAYHIMFGYDFTSTST